MVHIQLGTVIGQCHQGDGGDSSSHTAEIGDPKGGESTKDIGEEKKSVGE